MNLPLEQQAIRAKCFHPSGLFVEFGKEEIEQSISERFEQQVATYSARSALAAKGYLLTYTTLNQAAEPDCSRGPDSAGTKIGRNSFVIRPRTGFGCGDTRRAQGWQDLRFLESAFSPSKTQLYGGKFTINPPLNRQ